MFLEEVKNEDLRSSENNLNGHNDGTSIDMSVILSDGNT